MGKIIDKSLILNRVKEAYNLSGNSELARFLGIAPNTITNWYNRNSIDYDIVFSKCVNINTEWLLTGREPMLRETNCQNSTNMELVSVVQKTGNEQENSYLFDKFFLQLEEKNNEIKKLYKQIGSLESENNYLHEQLAEKNTIPENVRRANAG